jgi:hypothetical protein
MQQLPSTVQLRRMKTNVAEVNCLFDGFEFQYNELLLTFTGRSFQSFTWMSQINDGTAFHAYPVIR